MMSGAPSQSQRSNPIASLYRKHWRAFLPVWLHPIAVLLVVTAAEASSETFRSNAFMYGFVVAVALFIPASFQSVGLYLRREIGRLEQVALAMPFWLIAILCFALHGYIRGHI
jgi:hypothetical protein